MSTTILKNIDLSTPLDLRALVAYQEGQIVSRTLAQNNAVSLTLFAFAKGEEISSHASKGDAMVQVLDGTARITVGETEHRLTAGQVVTAALRGRRRAGHVAGDGNSRRNQDRRCLRGRYRS